MANGVSIEIVAGKIFEIKGKKVMLDRDLAKLYGVETYRLNEQVKRNRKRFPEDFMFQLTKQEAKNLISHFAISSWGGNRKLPYVFTQEGVAMLSSVLNSYRAVRVNIQIMRAFVQLRAMIISNAELKKKIEIMEKKYDKQFIIVFQALKGLLEPPKQIHAIGFHVHRE